MKALALLFVILAGCAGAPRPPCPVAKIHHLEVEGKVWFIVDYENLEAMRLRMVGLRDGTCEAGEFFGVDADAEQREGL